MNPPPAARSEAGLARLASELQADGSTAAAGRGGPGAARQIAGAAAAEPGTADVLVSNAATGPQARFHSACSPRPEPGTCCRPA